MEQLEDAFRQAVTYPSNLVCSEVPVLYLRTRREELQSQASSLFCDNESAASVDFLQRYENEQGANFDGSIILSGVSLTDQETRCQVQMRLQY